MAGQVLPAPTDPLLAGPGSQIARAPASQVADSSLWLMERPPPDPGKLLRLWMEWERGDATPGRAMANLKTVGLRDLLEGMAAGAPTEGESQGAPAEEPADAAPPGEQRSSWALVV